MCTCESSVEGMSVQEQLEDVREWMHCEHNADHEIVHFLHCEEGPDTLAVEYVEQHSDISKHIHEILEEFSQFGSLWYWPNGQSWYNHHQVSLKRANNFTLEDIEHLWLSPQWIQWGEYGAGGIVGRANVVAFLEEYIEIDEDGDELGIKEEYEDLIQVAGCGIGSGEIVCLNFKYLLCEYDHIKDLLSSVEDTLMICEDTHSRVEMELSTESLEHYLYDIAVGLTEGMHVLVDDCNSANFIEAVWQVINDNSIMAFAEGADMTWPVEEIVRGFNAEILTEHNVEFKHYFDDDE